ncbi:MAG: hypothetical protein L6282_10130 [Candidatus Methanoperedenaceae archaeon]|nr:hypothetical protein [Candidatus Methanoperedenaceae archaeon]
MIEMINKRKIYNPLSLFSYKNATKEIEMSNSKRVMVSFTEKQWEVVEKLKGEFGDNDANIVRNIVLAWLSEKSFITDSAKSKK